MTTKGPGESLESLSSRLDIDDLEGMYCHQ